MTGARPFHSLLIALLLALPTAIAHSAQMVSIDRPEVNMRAGASTNEAALWTLSRGYPLMVIGRQGKWYRVRDFEGDEGWVYRSLTGSTPHHVVKTQVARVRSGPGVQHSAIGRVVYGEVLRTLERRGDWVRVRTPGGLSGWVARRLLWGW